MIGALLFVVKVLCLVCLIIIISKMCLGLLGFDINNEQKPEINEIKKAISSLSEEEQQEIRRKSEEVAKIINKHL
jgi:hypothetical protein